MCKQGGKGNLTAWRVFCQGTKDEDPVKEMVTDMTAMPWTTDQDKQIGLKSTGMQI